MSKKKTTNEKTSTTGLASRRLLIVADSLFAGLDKLDTMPEWGIYDVPDNVAEDQHVSIVHFPAKYENGRRTFPPEGCPCGYAFAFNFDGATDHECLRLRQAFADGLEVVAISTSDNTRGLPFAKKDVVDVRTNNKSEKPIRQMTPAELNDQFAVFADEVSLEHKALCTKATVTGEEAALGFLRKVDPAAKWLVARDHSSWRRLLRRLPCSGKAKGQKTWTQETLVQWYYIKGRDIVTKT